MALTATLMTQVTADTSQFKKSINDASNHMEGFSKKFLQMGTIAASVVGVGLVGAFGTLLHMINSTTDEIDTLVHTASKLGTTVAAVQKLQYAANLADVSTESLNSGMGKLVRVLSSADHGAGALAKVGIAVADLKGLQLDAIFVKIAEKIALMPKGLEQASAATAIFGRGAMSILELLNSDIKGASQEFESFGAVLTEQGAAGVAAYQDETKKLSAAFDAFKVQLTVAIAQPLTLITEYIKTQIVEWGGLGNIAKYVAELMVGAFIGVAKGVQLTINGVETVIQSFQKLKLIMLEVLQASSNLDFAIFGGDLNMDRMTEIARLKKESSEPHSNALSGLIRGLRAGKAQIAGTNKENSNTQKLDITVSTTEGFALQIANADPIKKAINDGIMQASDNSARQAIR